MSNMVGVPQLDLRLHHAPDVDKGSIGKAGGGCKDFVRGGGCGEEQGDYVQYKCCPSLLGYHVHLIAAAIAKKQAIHITT